MARLEKAMNLYPKMERREKTGMISSLQNQVEALRVKAVKAMAPKAPAKAVAKPTAKPAAKAPVKKKVPAKRM